MNPLQRQQDVRDFVRTALECSIYHAPLAFGLSFDELKTVGSALGFQEGELSDALSFPGEERQSVQGRWLPEKSGILTDFLFPKEPDFRSVPAFDYVTGQLQALVRGLGISRAQIDRNVLLESAAASGLKRQDVEIAIAMMVHGEHLVLDGESLRFAPGREMYPLPSAQLEQSKELRGQIRNQRHRDIREKVFHSVGDIVRRRADGRPSHPEPLDALGTELPGLGLAQFKLWWIQLVAETRRLDPTTSPMASIVLCAALIEGALTFVARYARGLNLGVFGSRNFENDPRTWKIDDLVSSAAAGGSSAILDESTRRRADELIRVRQRIHAGRLLSEHLGGVPDFRPEEAREARETAELVVRRVVDWLERHPSHPSGAVAK